MHGIVMVWFFLIPSIPTTLGNFMIPLMIGARDLAFPRLNLAELVFLHRRRADHARRFAVRRGRHRLDLLRRLIRPSRQRLRDPRRARHFRLRLLLGPDRPQLHRHHPQAARAGPDLVPAAGVRLVDLCDQPDPRAGDAGAGDDLCCCCSSSGCSMSASSTRRSAAIRCSSSTCSGSTATRRSTS